jgi:hypothetical protein
MQFFWLSANKKYSKLGQHTTSSSVFPTSLRTSLTITMIDKDSIAFYQYSLGIFLSSSRYSQTLSIYRSTYLPNYLSTYLPTYIPTYLLSGNRWYLYVNKSAYYKQTALSRDILIKKWSASLKGWLRNPVLNTSLYL